MGIIKRAGDLVYTFRFLRLLTTSFEDTQAFKHGIIDKDGKRNKEFTLNTVDSRDKYSEYYTPFHRLVFNIKRIMAKAPGGGSKLASYAAALYLLKEKYNISDKKINSALSEAGVDCLDFISEQSQWFILEDKRLSPGVYTVLNEKLLNDNMDDRVSVRDKIRVNQTCYPVGDLFGLDIYEATHIRTNKNVYVSVAELAR
jgi:hypothetical protein